MLTIKKMDKVSKKHLPIAILIDCSESVQDIQALLNSSIRKMVWELNRRVELRQYVELLVVQYNDFFRVPAKFEPVSSIQPGQLDIRSCEGTTYTGMAILKTLQMLQEQQMVYEGSKEKCTMPLMFLFTDGYPDAGEGAPKEDVEQVAQDYQEAATLIKELEAEGALYFCAAGIQRQDGFGADMDMLKKLSDHPDRIVQVIGDDNGGETISRFCKVICDTATALRQRTPLADAMEQML